MRLTYHGNQVFSLPLGPGKFQSWKKGETHPVSDEVWQKFKERDHVKVLVDNRVLHPMGETQSASVKKADAAETLLTYLKKQPGLSVETQESPKSSTDFGTEFRKLNYKTAIKGLDDLDRGVLIQLLAKETRPSVKKALEAKLGAE